MQFVGCRDLPTYMHEQMPNILKLHATLPFTLIKI